MVSHLARQGHEKQRLQTAHRGLHKKRETIYSANENNSCVAILTILAELTRRNNCYKSHFHFTANLREEHTPLYT